MCPVTHDVGGGTPAVTAGSALAERGSDVAGRPHPTSTT